MLRGLGGFDPRATYSAAAEAYERASQKYWKYLSTRTVGRLRLQPGHQVLDVACGTGPATIAAARDVTPGGRVVGVDYAEGMLAVARRTVADCGLPNIELLQGNMLSLPYGDEFDVVLCVLGLFFVDDMHAAGRALWSHVRPGGRLALTTFGADVWEPVLAHFVEAAGRASPDIERILPWRRAEDPALLEDVMRRAGAADVRVETDADDVPFGAADWPLIVMGSGLRRIANDLGPLAGEVIGETITWAANQGLTSVRISSNYAVAVKAEPARQRELKSGL
jgi:ubiquinone/menaquinone biosynthesis C-methylase UbiE